MLKAWLLEWRPNHLFPCPSIPINPALMLVCTSVLIPSILGTSCSACSSSSSCSSNSDSSSSTYRKNALLKLHVRLALHYEVACLNMPLLSRSTATSFSSRFPLSSLRVAACSSYNRHGIRWWIQPLVGSYTACLRLYSSVLISDDNASFFSSTIRFSWQYQLVHPCCTQFMTRNLLRCLELCL